MHSTGNNRLHYSLHSVVCYKINIAQLRFVQHFSPYVIIEGAFNKKMKFIFNTLGGNGNKLFVLLGF